MRTTLDLEKPVLQALKRLQKQEKASLGSVASRLLAEALHQREIQSENKALETFSWSSINMKSRVDIADKDALHRSLDEVA